MSKNNNPDDNETLLAFQLKLLFEKADENKQLLLAGFKRIDEGLVSMRDDINALKQWRAGMDQWKITTDERLKESPYIPDKPGEKSKQEKDWVKIIIAICTGLGFIIGTAILASKGIKAF